jgi:hypothetical protein
VGKEYTKLSPGSLEPLMQVCQFCKVSLLVVEHVVSLHTEMCTPDVVFDVTHMGVIQKWFASICKCCMQLPAKKRFLEV